MSYRGWIHKDGSGAAGRIALPAAVLAAALMAAQCRGKDADRATGPDASGVSISSEVAEVCVLEASLGTMVLFTYLIYKKLLFCWAG